MTLDKGTENVNNGLDKLNESINSTLGEASMEIKSDLCSIDDTLENTVDMEKVREAERQAEESVNETLNSNLDSVQDALNSVNKGLDNLCNDDGTPVANPDNLKIQPIWAALLGIILPGIPQLINGQKQKGLIIFCGALIINFLACVLCIITIPIISTLSAIDAYKCAKKLSEGKSLTKYELGF